MGTIASERWKERDTEGVAAHNMKLIRELTGNSNFSKIRILIRLLHGHIQKLLLLFVRGDQFTTKSERTVEYQRIGSQSLLFVQLPQNIFNQFL